MSEHSKLPWKCSDTQVGWWDIWNTKVHHFADCDKNVVGDNIGQVDTQANAEYIVKCCNEHKGLQAKSALFDEIVEALKKTRGDMDSYSYDESSHKETGSCSCWLRENVDAIDAILVRAKEL